MFCIVLSKHFGLTLLVKENHGLKTSFVHMGCVIIQKTFNGVKLIGVILKLHKSEDNCLLFLNPDDN